ncbi:MAG: hypothetical protein JST22_06870 [Bacteroidetes bacterium]|nr:hypothetical protein [Bacteroidota bacterium]
MRSNEQDAAASAAARILGEFDRCMAGLRETARAVLTPLHAFLAADLPMRTALKEAIRSQSTSDREYLKAADATFAAALREPLTTLLDAITEHEPAFLRSCGAVLDCYDGLWSERRPVGALAGLRKAELLNRGKAIRTVLRNVEQIPGVVLRSLGLPKSPGHPVPPCIAVVYTVLCGLRGEITRARSRLRATMDRTFAAR